MQILRFPLLAVLLVMPFNGAAGEETILFQDDFEKLSSQDGFSTAYDLQEYRENTWALQSGIGIARSQAAKSPGGDHVAAVSVATFPGFVKNAKIQLSIDTRIGMRWETPSMTGDVAWRAYVVTPDAPKEAAKLGFSVSYTRETSAGSTEYIITGDDGSIVTWNPAPTLEGYARSGADGETTGWVRWLATWKYDPATKQVHSVLSVYSLGEHGDLSPTPIESWDFGSAPIPDGSAGEQLSVAFSGKARDGFGLDVVDDIVVKAIP